MQRTIRIQLDPSPAQVAALAETSRQFTAVFNAVCAYGWQQNEKNGIELHRALYYPLKAEYPALVIRSCWKTSRTSANARDRANAHKNSDLPGVGCMVGRF